MGEVKPEGTFLQKGSLRTTLQKSLSRPHSAFGGEERRHDLNISKPSCLS